jgi:uncharacterized protein YecE (DUF72 family)
LVANKNTQSSFRLGTSGIALPGPKSLFPPAYRESTRLTYYGSLFDTLEVNSCFYNIPKQQTFAKWATEVPDNFRFTVKLWKGVTHVKGLDFSPTDISQFVQAADGVGQKKGCLLMQFPASIKVDSLRNVESILSHLQSARADGWQLAIELRHSSWYVDAACQMFEEYGAAIVLHDMPASAPPFSLARFSHCIYLRFHGPTGRYNGSYSEEVLQQTAEAISAWQAEGKEVYVYFNNPVGDAFNNAMTLEGFLK